MSRRILLLLPFLVLRVYAQQSGNSETVMLQVLQRLDTLERQNQQLLHEVQTLKQQLDGSRPQSGAALVGQQPDQARLQEQVDVDEQRIAEQAQTKVEASQKFPISLNGMLLFNAFANSASPMVQAGGYGLLAGPGRSGATVRQTLLGLDFQGPSLPGGGRVNGSLMMDFWGGSSTPGSSWLRLRRADLSLDWPNRTFSVGQDKPLIAPYQPDSLAEVGVPPLAGAGNLWLWLPQARYEERLRLGRNSGFTGQIALMQTAENYQMTSAEYSDYVEQARPALEGRFAFRHKFDDVRRVEFAPGFHISSTHVAGKSVASHIASFDWRIVPSSRVGFSGTVYNGQNVASLGALGNGFTLLRSGAVRPVHSSGGWVQLSFPLTKRLTFNVFSGLEDDRVTYANPYYVARNFTYASNLMYHLGPNVVIGLEGLQMRTRSFSGIREIHNHYDLALGYLF